MNRLKFKSFIWPINPEVYHEDYSRDAIYAKTDGGDSVFSGMGPMKRVITGSGAFFGTEACDQFRELATIYASADPGLLSHPVWGVRTVYFTKLQMTQSPKSDYVAYSFEFAEVDSNGVLLK